MLQEVLFFVQGISETAGIIACSLALVKVKLRWGLIFAIGVVLTAMIYIIRNLPITFGLHTVAAILLTALFIARATRVPPSKGFMAVFVSFTVLYLAETTMNEVFIILLNTEISKVISEDTLWKLTGLPQSILLISIALLIPKYRKPLEGMWRI
ncbi:hypothetical protein DCCM_0367 [Desulfocucumis palustris]|uniref:Uncharacterized protein n=1 Tax=Desulfocucumis palustris TaxID=1898651 RepID=A0A2L2XD69_9FIRM|nr:hypothetical protein [Desulfocucumis palustris]GBF32176.1 hypothetical protein DCCM_0367 [Desulfocucumis palustris]